MKKEDLLKDDFLKQFKSGEELNDFLKQIQKQGIEKMLLRIVLHLNRSNVPDIDVSRDHWKLTNAQLCK